MPKRIAGMLNRAQDMPTPTAWACHPAKGQELTLPDWRGAGPSGLFPPECIVYPLFVASPLVGGAIIVPGLGLSG